MSTSASTLHVSTAALAAMIALSTTVSADDRFEPKTSGGDGPKLFFSGCGVLSIGPQGCTLLIADSGLTLAPDQLHSFVPGDRVFMTGIIETGVSPCFPADIPQLVVEVASYCLDVCGELVLVADDCVFLIADDGLPVFLGDTQEFEIGDRVKASGGQIFDFFCTGTNTYVGLIDAVLVGALGDLTCDQIVGPADLAELLAQWGTCEKFGPCPADFDNDGNVGPADLAQLLANWD